MSERFSISVRIINDLHSLHYALHEASDRNANPDYLRKFFPPTQLLTNLADISPTDIDIPLPPRQVFQQLCLAASELTLNIGHNARTLDPNHDSHAPLPQSLSVLHEYFPNQPPLIARFGFGNHAAYVSVTSPIDSQAQPINLNQAILSRNSDSNTTYSGLAHLQDHHSIGDWESRLYISDHPSADGNKLRTAGFLTWQK